MEEVLSFCWKNMKKLLLDEAFHYLYAYLFWRSSKLFGCAIAPLYFSEQLQHLASSIQKVTACLVERQFT